jgi:serine/threonine protein kinase
MIEVNAGHFSARFREDCLMVPLYVHKRVTAIALHSGCDIATLTGNEEHIQSLYLRLTRILNHKGFNEFYKPIKRLGRGTFATVYLVEHRVTGSRRAAKVFSKEGQKIEYKGSEALQN